MSEQDNIRVIRGVYAAFNNGDVAHIVSQLTDDVAWCSHLDPVIPWGGEFTKSEIPRFFDAVYSSVDVAVFDPQEWISLGDTVVSVGRFGGKVHRTGKSFVTRWAFLWK